MMFENVSELTLRDVDFEIDELAVRVEVPRQNLKFRDPVEVIARDELMYQMNAFIVKRDIAFQTATPATWWQHFKRDVFPVWLLKRFPIKYATQTITAKELFPEFKIPQGSLGRGFVTFRVIDNGYATNFNNRTIKF